jgi:hypothetical protein
VSDPDICHPHRVTISTGGSYGFIEGLERQHGQASMKARSIAEIAVVNGERHRLFLRVWGTLACLSSIHLGVLL